MLEIELTNPRKIYTSGSSISGWVHLKEEDPSCITLITVTLICKVRVTYDPERPEEPRERMIDHDGMTPLNTKTASYSSEENKYLLHIPLTLWSRRIPITPIRERLLFKFVIPDSGTDTSCKNSQVPLPPSFSLSGSNIAYVRYYIKTKIVRKGKWFPKLDKKATVNFSFFPTSPSPIFLPALRQTFSSEKLIDLGYFRKIASKTSVLNRMSTRPRGFADISLWFPDDTNLPMFTPIPFAVHLTFRGFNGVSQPNALPDISSSGNNVPSMVIRRFTRLRVGSNVQGYEDTIGGNIFNENPYHESEWIRVNLSETRSSSSWEKRYIWTGHWPFRDTPNFISHHISITYFLVVNIPVKGLGNDIIMDSTELKFVSGLSPGNATHSK